MKVRASLPRRQRSQPWAHAQAGYMPPCMCATKLHASQCLAMARWQGHLSSEACHPTVSTWQAWQPVGKQRWRVRESCVLSSGEGRTRGAGGCQRPPVPLESPEPARSFPHFSTDYMSIFMYHILKAGMPQPEMLLPR